MARRKNVQDASTLRFSPQQVAAARSREEQASGPLWGELSVLMYGVGSPPVSEQWRKFMDNGSEEYWVSDLGHFAVWRERPARHWLRNGYPQAVVYLHGKKVPRAIHTLVASAFLEWKPGDAVVRHLNSNPLDNHVNNLRPGTISENTGDRLRRRHGAVPTVVPPVDEVWKLSTEYAGVRVSNLGRVTLGWWLLFNTDGYRYRTGKLAGKKKHISLTVNRDAGKECKLLHRIVYETFQGELPKTTLVRHLNDDPHDNRLANLASGSHRQNAADRIGNGGQLFGEAHPNAKYTNEQRGRLLELIASGATRREAAAQVGMKIHSVHQMMARAKKGLPVRGGGK